jgi:predicted methyltransferase
MTVVEIWPGGGWYTEVLAPVLKDKGKLYIWRSMVRLRPSTINVRRWRH